MKKIAILATMFLLITVSAMAINTDSALTYGSANDVLLRSNPLAFGGGDTRIATRSMTITNPHNHSVNVTGFSFAADAKAKYNADDFLMNFSPSSFTLAAGASQTVNAVTVVPHNIDVEGIERRGRLDAVNPERVGTLAISYSSNGTLSDTSIPVRMYPMFMLDTTVEVYVDGQPYDTDDSDLREIRPGDLVRICVDLYNEFDLDDRVDIDAEITITSDNSDLRPRDRRDRITLDGGYSEELCFEIEERRAVRDGDSARYTVSLVATDDNNARYTMDFSIDTRYRSPTGLVEIASYQLSPSSVCPGDLVTVNYMVENVGRDDQRNVRTQIVQSQFNVDIVQTGIQLDRASGRDPSFTRSETFSVPNNAQVRDYVVRMNLIYRDDRNRDATTFLDSRLTVLDCSPPQPPVDNNNDNGQDIVITEPGTGGTTPPPATTVTARPVSSTFGGNNMALYVVGMIVLGLVLVAVIVYLLVIISRRP